MVLGARSRILSGITSLKDVTKSRINRITSLIRLPDKYKGGRLEKWGTYWQGVYSDYREVALDTVAEARKRPIKASIILSGIGLVIAAIQTNPDEDSFRDTLLECSNEMILVGESIRNPQATTHLEVLGRCYSEGLIQRLNLGLFSVIWVRDYDAGCSIYKSQCKYLQPRYLTFHQRIVDVGIFGMWLVLPSVMKDFDINPEEWTDGKNAS